MRAIALIGLWAVLSTGCELPRPINPDSNKGQQDVLVGERVRRDVVRSLIAVLKRKVHTDLDCGGSLDTAIYRLGKLRAAEAVDALSRHLQFVPTDCPITEKLPREYFFVAAPALAQIGPASIDRMLAVVRESEDQTERELAAWVLMKVKGREQAVAALQASRSRRVMEHQRLKEAARWIEEYEPRFVHPAWGAIPPPEPRGSTP